ncbi:hypothetical protein G6F46_002929 [Rhizopus delemar]|uniref:Uncharacterized protein n=1 Tax=Rhizopus oryzae TaxID=64495 RepID=A0A9P6YIP8_RHIOR|nr:hypothetical protein G6F54_002376 [Rhizopus delemar]KAG1515976.1 hypothetical protein G6F53_002514 [Rhizopus delemar]KAG1549463.1 hypothetical protein G6F51_003044 [Rhizopus arrhizus]KAG1619740.1 hypothetical protein G6F46_002929 [Rhizopus delemar]KAG1643263.1 hypothetical protein G6F44_004009 [Rhizopus delemar]
MTNKENKSETTLLIESLRPYLLNRITLQLKGIQGEYQELKQAMKPDLTHFINPLLSTNHELLFVEVKRKENYANRNLENDLIKLGKEMQIALDKLVMLKIKEPKVVGILVEVSASSTFSSSSRRRITLVLAPISVAETTTPSSILSQRHLYENVVYRNLSP